MSFGISVGDFIAVGKLVFDTYNAYKEAPDQFRSISQELHSLHIIVRRVEHQVQGQNTLDLSQQAELKVILEGLQSVLTELDKLLKDYHDLGSTGFSFDRLTWGKEDIVELRGRIVSNTTLLTAFNTSLTHSQLAAMRGQLGQLLALRRKGSSASLTGSIASVALSLRSKAAWKDLYRALHSNEITVPMLQNKLPEILNLFQSTTSKDAGSDTGVPKVLEGGRKGARGVNLALKPLDVITGRLLYSAVERGDVEAVRLWSALVSDIDHRGVYGWTALHCAACLNAIECLQLLLEKGGTIDAKTDDGLTVLHIAAYWGQVECLQLLLEKGATIDAKTYAGLTALHGAACWGQVECLRLLLEKGGNINIPDVFGNSVLHALILFGQSHPQHEMSQIINTLLDHGADIFQQNNDGKTPLDLASGLPKELSWIAGRLHEHVTSNNLKVLPKDGTVSEIS